MYLSSPAIWMKHKLIAILQRSLGCWLASTVGLRRGQIEWDITITIITIILFLIIIRSTNHLKIYLIPKSLERENRWNKKTVPSCTWLCTGNTLGVRNRIHWGLSIKSWERSWNEKKPPQFSPRLPFNGAMFPPKAQCQPGNVFTLTEFVWAYTGGRRHARVREVKGLWGWGC